MAHPRERDIVKTGNRYRYHCYNGRFHKIPRDWRFPRVGVMDVWRQWWIGDTVRSIPPLKKLFAADLKHLVGMPLGEEEMHGRAGGSKYRRRESRKLFCEMKNLMDYMTSRITEEGNLPE